MIDAIIRKYKKGAQHVKEFRTKLYAIERPNKTCADVWQRIKRNAAKCTRNS